MTSAAQAVILFSDFDFEHLLLHYKGLFQSNSKFKYFIGEWEVTCDEMGLRLVSFELGAGMEIACTVLSVRADCSNQSV